jgi:acyl-CoA thioesterase-1
VPFFLEDLVYKPELFQADRLHPTEAAQPLLLERVWTALRPLLK